LQAGAAAAGAGPCPARAGAGRARAHRGRVSMSDGPRVILASTSRYRAELLRRLLPAFTQEAPDTDEAPMSGEVPATRAVRLAAAKARAVAARHENTIVIGSDQVASLDGDILRKPGDAATARVQLARSSGRTVEFFTAACL